MRPLFGLAGLAEAALAEVAGMLCLGVVLVFVAASVTVILRSRIMAVMGTTVWAILAVWLQPWLDFSPEPSNDPDMKAFQFTYRLLAWLWVALP